MESYTVLKTSAQIVEYVEGLSRFIRKAEISEVNLGTRKFVLRVRVPSWYAYFFERGLKKRIRKNLDQRINVGVYFDVEVYSTELF